MKLLLLMTALAVFSCATPAREATTLPPPEPEPVPEPAILPSTSEWLNGETSKWGDAFAQALTALEAADYLYHLIADSPLEELAASSAEIGREVTRVRDLWRRAKSYNLSGLLMDCTYYYNNPRQMRNGQTDTTAQEYVPITVQTADAATPSLQYSIVWDYPYDTSDLGWVQHARLYLVSSRQRPIAELGCSKYIGADEDLDVTRHLFADLLGSDSISIPDLIVNIKR